jgi:hypothetical protein
MKKQLAVVVLLALTSLAQAEMTSFTHDFHALYTASPKKLTVTNTNHTGTTSDTSHDLVYSCSGTAVFAYEDINPFGYQKLSVSMPSSTAVVATTSAIEGLKRVEIMRMPVGNTGNIQIQVSEYADFRTIITNDTTIYYTSGVVEARFPKGTYYVRLVKTNNNNLFVTSIIYYQEPCHCLRVVSE